MKNKILNLLVCLMLIFSVSVLTAAAQSIPDTRQCERLVDGADLLSDSEEEELLSLLDSESESNLFDIVIHTTDSIGSMDIASYSDDYFDYNGFGYGESGDGLVLVVAMDIREYFISTSGSGIGTFDDGALTYCEDAFVPYLSSGDYYSAFSGFITSATEILEGDYGYSGDYDYDYDYDYNIDYGYDYDYGYDDSFYFDMETSEILGFSVIAGFVIALVIACVHASKLKSVRSQRTAVNYVEDGSFCLTQNRDTFLYKHVTKKRRPKQTSSGTGGRSGGVRMGSSGRSHGGRGGRF